MRERLSRLPAVLFAAGLPLAGCAGGLADRPATPAAQPATGVTAAAPPPAEGAAALYRRLRGGLQDGLGRTLPDGAWAPRRAYPVGRRTLALARGADRPLPTIVWYPAPATGQGHAVGPVTPVAAGRFPLVLLSHGLHGRPERLTALASRWAAAGFVVAVPAYPHTHARAPRYRRSDIVHQPADAAYVIDALFRLDSRPGDPLAGRLDTDRVGAAGHSAGGFTTAGLFTEGHHPSLRAGVVIAGWAGPAPFGGPPARLLFVHGTADTVVPPAAGRAAFHRVPWPAAMLTLPGVRHGGLLRPGRLGFAATLAATTEFLRWTLYDDDTARARLSTRVALPDPADAVGHARW